jgi:hypothetical protein
MELVQVKTNNMLPHRGSIAKQQRVVSWVTFQILCHQTIDKEMGTSPKTLAQRLAPAPLPGGIKYYDPSQVDRYTQSRKL